MSKCGNNCKCRKDNSDYESTNLSSLQDAIFGPPEIGQGYTLTLSDVGTNDGYRIKFTTDISVFEFFNLYSEYFDSSSIEIDFDELD